MNYSGKEHRDYLLAEQCVAILFTIEKILYHLFQLRPSLSEVRKAFSDVLFSAQIPKQKKTLVTGFSLNLPCLKIPFCDSLVSSRPSTGAFSSLHV